MEHLQQGVSEFDSYYNERDDDEKLAMLEIYKDYIEFSKQRGIESYSPSNRIIGICSYINKTEKLLEKYIEFHQSYKIYIDDILNLSELHKLAGIRTVSGKLSEETYKRVNFQQNHNMPAIITPQIIDRYYHSITVADYSLIIGLKIGLSQTECLYLYLGGSLHDIGQSSLSHDGDAFLTDMGLPNHEDRSISILYKFFDMNDAKKIYNIIVNKDKAGLGKILNITDTLVYIEQDCKAFQLCFDDSLAPRLVHAIESLDSDGNLIFNETKTVLELLEKRYILHRSIYYAIRNKIRASATWNLLDIAINNGALTRNSLLEKTPDDFITMIFQNMRDNHNNTNMIKHEVITDLYEIYMGFKDITIDPCWENIYIEKHSALKYFHLDKFNAKIIRENIKEYISDDNEINHLILPIFPYKLSKTLKIKYRNENIELCYNEPNFELHNLGLIIFYPKQLSPKMNMLKLSVENKR